MRKNEPIVVAETEDYIAVSKPTGMLTLPDRHDEEKQSLRGWMEEAYGKIFVVHRLDKDTSGLILFAKNAEVHQYYNALFEERKIEKIYLGIVDGKPFQQEGIIDAPIAEHSSRNGTMIIHARGKASRTDYRVLQSWNSYSLLSFTLHTGRTHQIRIHCRHIGHPIACDPFYNDGKPVLLSSLKKKFKLSRNSIEENPLLSRLALHSYSLGFIDRKGEKILLQTPLPKDFQAFVKQLNKL
jgi:23S rRNA pseudouridine955/2504/2580 synthase/23S rRNA pseudouridine1911/1915/1917 synthase